VPGNDRRKTAPTARQFLCGAQLADTGHRHRLSQPLGERIAGRAGGCACGIHLELGRQPSEGRTLSPTEDVRREARRLSTILEGINHERRGSDDSVIPELDYRGFKALPSPEKIKRFPGRTTLLGLSGSSAVRLRPLVSRSTMGALAKVAVIA
jgi:hypothetical protein